MALLLSFIVALLLNLVPLPDWAAMYRPDWVVLVLIYWCIELPDKVGAGVGFAAGLLVDITQANLLGLNALGMTVVGYVSTRFHLRMRMFPWWQQAAFVFVMLLIYRAVVGWIRGLIAPGYLDFYYWIPCLIGMLIWPWLFVVLRDVLRVSKRR